MKPGYVKAFLNMVRMPGLIPIIRDWQKVVRMHFIHAAVDAGLPAALAVPRTFEELVTALDVQRPDILEALLKVGLAVKELSVDTGGRYRIKGKRSRAMAGQYGDVLSAVVQANVTYYNSAYRHAAERMKGAPLGDDLDYIGDMVARFSKLAEPVIGRFIADIVRGKPSLRLLDVGCGSGIFLKCAWQANPKTTGIGIDMDPEVTRQAAQNIADWGLAGRFEIVTGNVLSLPADAGPFDLITLNNVLYYFPENERIDLFKSFRARLSPSGSLAIAMNMQGAVRDVAAANLNLANTSFKGLTPLPDPETTAKQLAQSGFGKIQTVRFFPGTAFMGIHATAL